VKAASTFRQDMRRGAGWQPDEWLCSRARNMHEQIGFALAVIDNSFVWSVVVRPSVALVTQSVGRLNYLYLLASGQSLLIVERSIS
jgi:hypothetical protein